MSRASFWRLVQSDMARYVRAAAAFQEAGIGLRRSISILLTPPLLCSAFHRVAHAAHLRGWIRLARTTARINMILHHAIIDPAAEIGPGLYIPHPSGVIFRGTAGANLTLYS